VTPFPQLVGADELVLRAKQEQEAIAERAELSEYLANLQKP
jgi:hypothetical protein